jgi:hypothetical protein
MHWVSFATPVAATLLILKNSVWASYRASLSLRLSNLSGLRQGIRREDFDRVALVEALAAPAVIEVAALFKLIELALRY